MDTRRLVKGKDLKELLKVVNTFHTESKLYEFANYLYLRGKDGHLQASTSLVLGEAISSGMTVMRVPYKGEDFEEVSIPMKEVEGLDKLLSDEELEFDVVESETQNYVEIEDPEATIRLNTAHAELPPMFYNYLEEMRKEEANPIDVEEVVEVAKILNRELKNQVISYVYQGIYLSNAGSYVTNGIYMIGHKAPLDIKTDIYLPTFAVKVLESLPKQNYTYSQKVLGYDQTASPYIYIKGDDGLEIYFQEWMSKDVYPVEMMKQMIEMEGTTIPLEDVSKAIKWGLHKDNLVTFHFQEGVARSDSGKYTVDIGQQALPDLTFSKTVLPNERGVNSFMMAEVLDTGALKFSGAMMVRICTNVVTGG